MVELRPTVSAQDGLPQASPGVAASPGAESVADLSALPRADLEQLCAARAQKLQLAVGKLRTVHTELKRVQRDYEQLQSIVRSDAGQGAAEQPKEAASDNVEVGRDSRAQELAEENAALKQQLEAVRNECDGLRAARAAATSDAAAGSGVEGSGGAARVAELEETLRQKEEIVTKLKENAKKILDTARAQKGDLAAAKEEKRKLDDLLAAARRECAQLHEAAAASVTAHAAEREESERIVADLRGECEQLRAAAAAAESGSGDAAAELAAERAKLEAELEAVRSECERLQSQEVRAGEEAARLATAAEERDSLRAECEQLRAESDSRSAQAQALASECAALRQQTAGSEKAATVVVRAVEEVEGLREALRRESTALGARVDGSEESLSRATEALDALQRQIRLQPAGGATAKGAGAPAPACEECARLEQAAGAAAAAAAAAREEAAALGRECARLRAEAEQGATEAAADSECAARAERAEARVEQLESRLAELQARAAEDAARLQAAGQQAVSAAEARAAEAEARAAEADGMVAKAKEGAKKVVEAARAKTLSVGETLEASEARAAELEVRLARAEEQVAAAAGEVGAEALQGKVARLEGEVARLGAELVEGAGERERLAGEQRAREELAARFASLQGEVQGAKEEGKAARARSEGTERALAEARSALAAAEAGRELAERKAGELNEARSRLYAEREGAKEDAQDARAAGAKAEQEAAALRGRLAVKSREASALLSALRKAEEAGGQGPPPPAPGDGSRTLFRVWAHGTAWALVERESGAGSDGGVAWFAEAAMKKAAGEGLAEELAGEVVVLEDVAGREVEVARLQGQVTALEEAAEAVREEFRQYKIKAHSVLRASNKGGAAGPEQDAARQAREELEARTAEARALESAVARARTEAHEAAAARTREAEQAAAREAALQSAVDDAERRRAAASAGAEAVEERARALQEQVARLEAAAGVEGRAAAEAAAAARLREAVESKDILIRKLRARLRMLEEASLAPPAAACVATPPREDAAEQQGGMGSEGAEAGGREAERAREGLQSAAPGMAKQRATQPAAGELTEAEVGMLPGFGHQGLGWRDSGERQHLTLSGREQGSGESEAAAGADGHADAAGAAGEGGGYARGWGGGGHWGGEGAEGQEEVIFRMAELQSRRDERVAQLQEEVEALREAVLAGKSTVDLLCKERDALRCEVAASHAEEATVSRVARLDDKFRSGINMEYLRNVLVPPPPLRAPGRRPGGLVPPPPPPRKPRGWAVSERRGGAGRCGTWRRPRRSATRSSRCSTRCSPPPSY